MPREIPKTMTRCRKLVATSHEQGYAYYLDSRDLYVYQLRLADMVWIGWLCSLAVWETTYSKSGGFNAA